MDPPKSRLVPFRAASAAGRPQGSPIAVDGSHFHYYSEIVKNVTVTIDDETYRNARIAAAADDTSVSAVVREFLRLYAAESNVRGETAEDRFERL